VSSIDSRRTSTSASSHPQIWTFKTGRNQDKAAHVASRRAFYDWLAVEIKMPGIVQVARDEDFDDEKMRSGGIRLSYAARTAPLAGVKDGILLELGFDDTAPNRPVTISSWAWDTASARGISVMDNRAIDVPCYAPTHTFVEKLQTISTSTGSWVRHRRSLRTSCATTTMCTACCSWMRSRRS